MPVKNRVLVVGASGMLGRDVVSLLQQTGAEFLAGSRVPLTLPGVASCRLNISETDALRDVVVAFKPNWLINCAAYTAVDKAESEYEQAFAVNAAAVAQLAEICRVQRVRLLHVSTDYVFGGAKYQGRVTPFSEHEEPSPCGIYGISKWCGEALLRGILGEDFLLVRTSWCHGKHGPNFVNTMIRLGREALTAAGAEVRVVSDQFGSPTWTPWLAGVLSELMLQDARGIYHVSSRGNISWHDFALEIFARANIPVSVRAVTTAEFPRPAPRPCYSVLSLEKIEAFLGRRCLDWKEGLWHHLAESFPSAKDK